MVEKKPQASTSSQQTTTPTPTKMSSKVVMVTGASSGLGREFCLDLAKSGYNSNFGGLKAVAVELDVSADGKCIDASVDRGWSAFGAIHALVNNAGIRGNVRSPLETTEEEWDTTFNTNLKGAWLVSKSVCIRMRDAKIGGSIINISSIPGLNRGHLPGSAAYSASKAALNTLTKMMALELGMYNIRVNSISPGLFRSEITENLMEKDWLNKVAMKTVPLRTFGTSDPALTSLVRYLILDSSEYVTSNMFIVDAGATLPGVPIFSSL